MQCGHPYYQLLAAWASAGYVVAVVDFPHSDCRVGTAATETDMVNQPADVSYVITALLGLSGRQDGPMAGLINPGQIGITGQSDGGDTVAAVAANSCCGDPRVRAVAVLSGAEWPPMPGTYFRSAPVPMLFTQGSADTVNPPILSVDMYQQDPSTARFYLDLLGADHTTPYWGINPAERVVAQVTLDFFNRYLLGRTAAGQLMLTDGTVPGVASFSQGAQSAP
jgi:dienelactone hydrolase